MSPLLPLTLLLLACDQGDRPHPALLAALQAPGAGKILVDAPALGLPPARVVSGPLGSGDERAVAEALRARGIRFVLLRRDRAGAQDRGGAVLSRLYHGDDRRWFELRAVDANFLLYRVLDQPRDFPIQLARQVAAGLRARLKGEPPPALGVGQSSDGMPWVLVADLRRSNGPALGTGWCEADELGACLDALADDLAPLAGAIDDLSLDLHRLTERAEVLVRDEGALEGIWELGIDGAIVYDTHGPGASGGAVPLPGSLAYTRGYHSVDGLLAQAAAALGRGGARPWLDPENRLEKIRDVHYLDRPVGGVIPLVRGVPPLPMPLVDLDTLQSSLSMAGDWLLASAAPAAPPPEAQRSPLIVQSLAQAYQLTGREPLLEGAQRALGWTLARGEDPAVAPAAVLGMIAVAEASGTRDYDARLTQLGGLLDSAALVSGQALLALTRLSEYTGEPAWLARVGPSMDHDIPWWRAQVAACAPAGAWPEGACDAETRRALMQRGPWTVMALDAYHRVTGDARAADLGLEIARWMIESSAWSVETAPWPDYVGGYYERPGALPTARSLYIAQATAAAYDLALRARPEAAPFFGEATLASARFAVQLQCDADQLYPFSDPEHLLGGTRRAMDDTRVRAEDVAYAFSAVYQYLQAARSDPALPESVRRSPLRGLLMEVGRGPSRDDRP